MVVGIFGHIILVWFGFTICFPILLSTMKAAVAERAARQEGQERFSIKIKNGNFYEEKYSFSIQLFLLVSQ